MKTKIYYLILLLYVFTISCKHNNDDPVSSPNVTYEETTIDVDYLLPNSTEPTVNWNGNVGSFTLDLGETEGDPEFSINEDTGELSWTSDLEQGLWSFDVKATNSAGTTTIPITLDNRLDVLFQGSFQPGNEYLKFFFHKDGTLNLESNDPNNPTLSTGTWFQDYSGYIILNCTSASGYEFSFKGTINRANYTGHWYVGHNALEENEGDTFHVQYST